MNLEDTIATLENRDELLFSGNWIEVLLRDGWYEFSRYKTSNGGAYILPYRTDDYLKPLLGRFEITPAHLDDRPTLTTITGGINISKSPIDVAVQELEEEAGYVVPRYKMFNLGSVYLTKSSSDQAHLFTVDLTGMERGEAKGDGTRGEEGAYCKWVSIKAMINCKDPVACCILLRMWQQGLFHFPFERE